MERVESLSPVPGKRTVVVRAGDSEYEIAGAVVDELGLEPGLELTLDLCRRLHEAASRRAAAARALAYLSRRPRTELEMRRHLVDSGFEPAIVTAVLAELRAQAQIDDIGWAAWFVRARLAHRPTGFAALVREMCARGIASDLAEDAARRALPPDRELELARAAAFKRLPALRRLERRRAERRLFRFLAGRGFGDDTARAVCREFLDAGGEAET